jgi:Pin2-interacting protein X1
VECEYIELTLCHSRSRISNDPQNTLWANNTERFGHRILASHGWTPGANLGAKDASHASHYTIASNSHIRVLLKDDNLGLGAKRGSERAENFGLAGLESILGRLNGKEEEVKKEEARREDIERRGWVAQKYGSMNFVSGGFLVGDKIERKIKREVEVKVEIKEEELSAEETKPKKRRRDMSADDVKEESAEEEPKLKRKKKSKDLPDQATAEEEVDKAERKKSKKEKKDKKDKKDKSKSKKSTDSEPEPTPLSSTTNPEPVTSKAQRKAEKRARKEEKKAKKALKKAAKEAAESSSSSDSDTETPTISSAPTTGTSTPSGPAVAPRGYQAVRSRYIRQKKLASMDPQALREVCHIILSLLKLSSPHG